jgi:hypothetical protein
MAKLNPQAEDAAAEQTSDPAAAAQFVLKRRVQSRDITCVNQSTTNETHHTVRLHGRYSHTDSCLTAQ